MMNRKKEIIDAIASMSGRYSSYEVFTDWIRCMAMSISNSLSMIRDRIWLEREQVYIDTMRKYSETEMIKLCEMTAWLAETLEDGPDDVLGDIYMKSGMGSKSAGQFFTPFHLQELTARLGLPSSTSEEGKMMLLNDDVITLNEPSCGGGGMIIAAARVLHKNGINYQKKLRVVAQDLDWKGVYMCYVQLSLLGIHAICVQGNTLLEPYDLHRTPKANILITPRAAGALL